MKILLAPLALALGAVLLLGGDAAAGAPGWVGPTPQVTKTVVKHYDHHGVLTEKIVTKTVVETVVSRPAYLPPACAPVYAPRVIVPARRIVVRRPYGVCPPNGFGLTIGWRF